MLCREMISCHGYAAVAVLALAATGHGAVVNTQYLRMGEGDLDNDPNTLQAAVGTAFSAAGNPGGKAFSSDVPTNTVSGSTVSVDYANNPTAGFQAEDGFNQGQVAGGGASNNFGLELWVKTDTVISDLPIFNLGNPTQGGIQVRHQGGSTGQYYIQLNNVGLIFLGATDPGSWHHIAYVRDNGNGRAFFDGVEVTAADAYIAPTNLTTGIGNNIYAPANGYDGKIDEVRYFTFAAGQFVAPTVVGGQVIASGDLNIIPEPGSLALFCGIPAIGLLARSRRSR